MSTDINMDTKTGAAERLPEYWPEADSVIPLRAVWIPWPLAILLAPLMWIFPKTLGPHLARVRWPGVILAHLFWSIYGVGCYMLAFEPRRYGLIAFITGRGHGQVDPDQWGAISVWEVLRAPLAYYFKWDVADELGPWLSAWGLFLGIEMIIVLLGLLLMPWAAAGEKLHLLAGRCVKLTLLSTGALTMFGLAAQALTLGQKPIKFVLFSKTPELAIRPIFFFLFVVVWIWILLRSLLRYAGPAEGPAWQPQRPTCEKCGYLITGLSPDAHCPECGQPVARSLPSHRYRPAWATARWYLKPVAFVRTAGWSMLARNAFARLQTRDSHRSARTFALACAVGGGLLGGGSAWLWHERVYPGETWLTWQFGQNETAYYFLNSFAAVLAINILWILMSTLRHRTANLQRVAVGGFYAAGWLMWMPAVYVNGYLTAGMLTNDFKYYSYARAMFAENPFEMVTSIFLLTFIVGFLLLSLWRIAQAVKQTRSANG